MCKLFLESYVYIMSTACGRAQRVWGSVSSGHMWTDRSKPDFTVDIING